MLIYLSILGIDIAYLFKRNFSITISLSHFILVFVLYVFGLFLNLKLGMDVFIGLVILLTAWILLSDDKSNVLKIEKKKSLFDVIKDPALLIYFSMGILFGIVLRFYFPHYDTDEFSHWALVTKNMFYYDNFGNIGNTTTMFNRYEPASAVFMYAFQAYNSKFIDGYMYAAFDLMMMSLVLPVLGLFKEKLSLFAIISFALCFLLPLFVKPSVYSNLLVDSMLGLFCAYIFLVYRVDKGKVDWFTFVTIGLASFVVTLVKSSGIVFVVFGCIFILIYALTISIDNVKSFFKHKWNILWILIPIIFVAFAKASWSWYNNFYATRAGWNSSEMTLPNIIKWLTDPNDFQRDITSLWLNKFFICVPGYQWGAYLRVPAIAKFIITIILSIIVSKKLKSKAFGIANSITIILLCLGYAIFLLLLYLFSFAYEESYKLNCYERYSGSLTIAVLLIFAYLYIEAFIVPISEKQGDNIVLKTKKKSKTIKLSYKLFAILFSCITVLGITGGTIASTIYRKESLKTDQYYIDVATNISSRGSLYAVILEPHDENADGIGMDYLRLRYHMTPSQCNGFLEGGSYIDGREHGGSWSGNLFNMDMSLEKFETEVSKYDYLYVSETNLEFESKFGGYFISPIKENSYYIVSHDNTGKLQLAFYK